LDKQEIPYQVEILTFRTGLRWSFDQKSFELMTKAIDKFKKSLEWGKKTKKYYVTVDNEPERNAWRPVYGEDQLNEFKIFYFRLDVKKVCNTFAVHPVTS